MAKIIPKLNLNLTPQQVDNYSLVSAKNIKLNKDNSFSKDDAISKIDLGLGNSVNILGCISSNTKLYLFVNHNRKDKIYEYDEDTTQITQIKCGWKYSGGIIDGKTIVNLRGETLLLINEYFDEDEPTIQVPVKIINLAKCKADDDESIYTQTPKIRLFDLIHTRDYAEPIQSGVYTFFGRYEITDGFYTNWFPVSKPLYAGQRKLVNTIQGSIEYINEDVNCGKSFVFSVNRPSINPSDKNAVNNYKYLQIGFILKTDGGEVARTWKKFPVNITEIYFDNKKQYIKEIDINEFFKPIYNNYNVKNLINFKHKTYISNYIETNANPNLESFGKKFLVDIANVDISAESNKLYNGKEITITPTLINTYEHGGESKQIDVITHLSDETFADTFETAYLNKPIITNSIIKDSNLLVIEADSESYKNNLNKVSFSYYNQGTQGVDCITSFNYAMVNLLNETRDSFDKSTNSEDDYNWQPNGINDSVIYNVLKLQQPSQTAGATTKQTDGKLWYLNKLQLYVGIQNNEIIDLIELKKSSYTTTTVNYNNKTGIYTDNINGLIIELLKPYIYGITDDNNDLIIKITTNGVTKYYRFSECMLSVKYTYFNLDTTLEYKSSNNSYDAYVLINNKYYYSQDLYISANPNLFNVLTNLVKTNITTLIPEQVYNFYVHFIKDTGETTNGYYITSKKIVYDDNTADAIKNHNCFYPQIQNQLTDSDKNILKSLGYTCYYITAIKNNTTIECTDNQCLEYDLLLNRSDNVSVNICDNGTINVENGRYVDDNVDNNDLNYFGSGGYLIWDSNQSHDFAFIHSAYSLFEKNLKLNRITPYASIDESINYSYIYFNCLGYIVYYRKPTYEDTKRYISGGTVYNKTNKNGTIGLIAREDSIPFVTTAEKIIYSNYNLNYIRLSVSIQEQIRIYGTNDDSKKELIKFVNSLQLKDLYLLSSTYKDYTTYDYTNYNPQDSIYKFNNTIRASALRGDEDNTNILVFKAEDYYNVPTNKGIVVKLAGIGDTMLVHTKDSIFEFSGKPSLSSDSSAQIVETDIFDSGIVEVIPSEYGLAGLDKKHHGIVAPFGYIFWDAKVNTIYYYAGKGQLAPISDPIRKVLTTFNPTNIALSYDYYNDRFFVCFTSIDATTQTASTMTLSYNVKAKAFVSFHDTRYLYSVNTKNKTYFISTNGSYNIIGTLDTATTYKQSSSYKNSSGFYAICKNAIPNHNDTYESYIDIIVNNDYEKIKTLDAVTWICGAPRIETASITEDYYNLAEDVSDTPYPGNKMIIYSDSCRSSLITLHNENTKTYKDYTKGDYKLPVYNLGKFTLNYFRNTKFNNQPNTEQSLIYGKYFIIRIFFDKVYKENSTDCLNDFKLENIELLYTLNNYGQM